MEQKYFFEIEGTVQNQVYIGTKPQLKGLIEIIEGGDIEIKEVDARVEKLIEEYKEIRGKKMPVYIAEDEVGKKLRQRDDDKKTITTILVSKEGEVNYGWVIYPREKNNVDNSVLKHFSIDTNLELYEFGALVGRDGLDMRIMRNFMTELGSLFIKFSNKKNISYFGLRYDLENGAKSPMLTILSKQVSDNLIVLFGSPSINDKGDYGRVRGYIISTDEKFQSGEITIDNESFYLLSELKDKDWKAAYEGYQTEVANMLKATPSENLTKTTTVSKLQK